MQSSGEVTHVTLFYWRHKILAALKQIPTETFQGIVEMDETYFLFSEKGMQIQGAMAIFAVNLNRIMKMAD